MEHLFRHEKAGKYIILGISVAIFGAMLLAVIVRFSPLLPLDLQVSREIQEGSGRWLLAVMNLVSFFGDPMAAAVSVLGVSVLFFLFSYTREALFVLFVFAANGLNLVMKIAIGRPRPADGVVHVYSQVSGFSFPSGHVVHYVVFFGFLFALMFYVDRLPLWLRFFFATGSFFLMLTISVSRIYLGYSCRSKWKLRTHPESF